MEATKEPTTLGKVNSVVEELERRLKGASNTAIWLRMTSTMEAAKRVAKILEEGRQSYMLSELGAMLVRGPIAKDYPRSGPWAQAVQDLFDTKLIKEKEGCNSYELAPLGRMVATLTNYPPGHLMRRDFRIVGAD
ncbi:MAG: hypothetical protein KGH94_05535 [Candidatus Micrarchaeota archaeon]|nr:hypothetical protein [Candidatus Micrarchaeota archaeon]